MRAGGDLRIELVGGLRIAVDGRVVEEYEWPARRARELVALLCLAEGRRAPRDAVIEALWPHLGAQAGAANLRKAAHLARRALGAPEAITLRGGLVELFPGRPASSDADELLAAADCALAAADAAACAAIAARWPGELLPGMPYEAWTQAPRRRLRERLVALLRRGGDLERLLEVEPTDEGACRALMRAAMDAGHRHVALRRYERLRQAMVRELGVPPGPETQALYDECTAGLRLGEQVLLGREHELGVAMAQAQAVAGGGAAALVVEGAVGIGKSAFAREVAARLAQRGWRVLVVRATAPAVPYAPVGALVDALAGTDRDGLATLPRRTHAVLGRLAPLARPAPALEGALTRHQVVAALQRALALRAATPTLLVVDDAHLLDEASAGALHQLVAAGGEPPLLALLTARAESPGASPPGGLAALAQLEGSRSLALGPLTREEIAALAALVAPWPLAPETLARIARLADGNPFYATELARTPAGGLPDSIRAAVGRRLGGLDAGRLDAVTTLAVAEDELDLGEVLALTGLTEPEAFACLDAALAAGALVVAGTRYRFRHELVRQALIETLPAHRRVQLHRRAAQRLTDAGAPPARIADHWIRGERDVEALPWLLRAARTAMALGAFTDALVQVDQLLARDGAHHDGLVLRAEILDALGDGRAPGAYAAAADALGDPPAQELRARQALAQLKASDPDGALRTLAGIAPRSTAGRLAEALTLSAAAAIGRYADAETAARKAEEARELALELGDPGAILDATWAHALAAHAKGELPARLREYLRQTHALPELATRVFDGQLCVTERMLYGGLPNDEIIAFADGLAAEAARIGAARGQAFALTLRGEAEILAGRLDEAERDFTDGARLHGSIGAAAGEALSLLGRGQVAIRRGRSAHARPVLEAALRLARESEVGHHTLDRVYGAIVEAAAADADVDAGLRAVVEAETAIQGPAETCPTCRIAFIVPATIAAARAGDLVRARRYAGDCVRALEIVALPPAWTAAVEEARGWLAGAEGRAEEARACFAAAADGFDAWGQPLDAARCRARAAG
jgi:DNA-binding SARP family transcriptional activator/tetratricopeptide (TPR) repeat protein